MKNKLDDPPGSSNTNRANRANCTNSCLEMFPEREYLRNVVK